MFSKNDQTILLIAMSFAKSVMPAFYAFSAGLVMIAMVSAIAYFNWAWVAHSWPDPGQLHHFIIARPGDELPPSLGVKINLSLYFAVVFGFLSLACFVFGIVRVASAFATIGAS